MFNVETEGKFSEPLSRRNFLLLGMMMAAEVAAPNFARAIEMDSEEFVEKVQESSDALQASFRTLAPHSNMLPNYECKVEVLSEEEYKDGAVVGTELSDLGNDRKTLRYDRTSGPFIFELIHHYELSAQQGTLDSKHYFPDVSQYDQETKVLSNIYVDSLENPILIWEGDVDSYWQEAVVGEPIDVNDELVNYQGKKGVVYSNKDTSLNDVQNLFVDLAHFQSDSPWVSAIDTPQLMGYLFSNGFNLLNGESTVYANSLYEVYQEAVKKRDHNAQGVVLSLLAGIFLASNGLDTSSIKHIIDSAETINADTLSNIDDKIIDYLKSKKTSRRDFLGSAGRAGMSLAGLYAAKSALSDGIGLISSQQDVSGITDRTTKALIDNYFSKISVEALPDLTDGNIDHLTMAYRGMLESIIYNTNPSEVHPGLIVMYLRDLIGAYKTHVLSQQLHNDFGQEEQMAIWGSEHYRQIGLHDLSSDQIFSYLESFFQNYKGQIEQIITDPLIRASLYTGASFKYKVNTEHDELKRTIIEGGGYMTELPGDDFVPHIEKTDCVIHRFAKLERLVGMYLE